jgi:sugar lactone lactonase YvrE
VKLLVLLLCLLLATCAVDDVGAPARGEPPRASALLTPWRSPTGGWRLDAQPRLPLAPAPGAGPRLNFLQPVGVAAHGDVVLVADASARTIWRMERSRDAMAAFAPYSASGAEQGASLQIGDDFSVWVALPAERRVVQYDPRGRLVRQWRDEADAMRPVAVAVPPDRSEVLVADSANAQVVVFDPLGRAQRLLGRGRARALQSVSALAFGPDGLYVLDRVAQQVVVLDANGNALRAIGENQLTQPRALAVDRSGRVFVSDDAGQVIKVFRGTQLLDTFGGEGAGPMRFGRIEALAIDGNLLYVADSLNARVQVLLVAPPSMEKGMR